MRRFDGSATDPELSPRVEAAVQALADRYRLTSDAGERLLRLVGCVALDPHAPTSVREPMDIVDRHLADSLVALELQQLDRPLVAVDLGSGAGFPGLPLAVARPQSEFVLLEANGRKSEFIQGVAGAVGATNAVVANARAESWPEGLGRFDLVAARAVGGLNQLVEYAAPLLKVGGVLVAWRGKRDAAAERAAERAGELVGMRPLHVRQVRPFPGAQTRYLHLISKLVETPPGFPRRPGMAVKRPLGTGP